MESLENALAAAYRTMGDEPELVSEVDRILVEFNADPAIAAFERAGAFDYLGQEAAAIPLYREAIALGLRGSERLRCTIQLASSLRNVGQSAEAVAMLREAHDGSEGAERDWADAFLALALHSAGDKDEALQVALGALAQHLTRYGRAVKAYAGELME